MGHHNANLDPLGISCVNFDESPVATGFQHVGEKCFLYPTAQQTIINEPILCDCRFPLPFICPSFSHFLLSPVFQLLYPCTRHFISSSISLHLNILVLLLFCTSSSVPAFSPFYILSLWVVLRSAPMFVGGPLVSCRYVVTMWLSWTLLGLWMLIWIRAFPMTLLHHRINLVRNCECVPNLG